jgi:hypothetical protein
MSRFMTPLLFLLAAVAFAPVASADTIVAVFSDPVLAGMIPSHSAPGRTYLNNIGTAVYNISNSAAGSSLRWGTATPERYQTYSELLLIGDTIPSDTSVPFSLATLTYTNGTSADVTGIFGASISFYDGYISAATFLGADQLIITNTANYFGHPGGVTTGDDDFISICGNNSSLCLSPVEAVESSEGGTTVTVDLFGTIPANSMGITPEPGSFTLLLTGCVAGTWLFKRRWPAPRA